MSNILYVLYIIRYVWHNRLHLYLRKLKHSIEYDKSNDAVFFWSSTTIRRLRCCWLFGVPMPKQRERQQRQPPAAGHRQSANIALFPILHNFVFCTIRYWGRLALYEFVFSIHERCAPVYNPQFIFISITAWRFFLHSLITIYSVSVPMLLCIAYVRAFCIDTDARTRYCVCARLTAIISSLSVFSLWEL